MEMSISSSVPNDDKNSGRRDLELALGSELSALLSASRVLTERSAAAFHPDLQPAAFHLARWLFSYGPVKPSTLAESVGMDRSSTSSLIRSMKALNLLKGTPDPSDKRAVIVSLTSEGEARVKKALDLRGTSFFDRIKDWNDADVETLARLLHAFNHPSGKSSAEDW